MSEGNDNRRHLQSMLARESLLDKEVMASTETPVVSMLPDVHVIKIGGRSILEAGRETVMPLIEALQSLLRDERLILGVGCGARSRHVFSVGLDLGLPTGVLAELSAADALGNAHMLGTLLAPQGVVAIPPEMFGHLLPLFIRSAPGVIFNGVPPYSLWEHPSAVGNIPKHRTDAGCLLLAECFGCRSMTLVKDVDGLYTADPKANDSAQRIDRISVSELRQLALPTLPFDEVVLDVLESARQVRSLRLIDGRRPDSIRRALDGEETGTLIYAE